MTKEERILRQTKRTKNKKIAQKPNSLPKVNGTSYDAATDHQTIQKRLICPVMPDEIKQVVQRERCFVKLSTDNYIRYFVSRPQV